MRSINDVVSFVNGVRNPDCSSGVDTSLNLLYKDLPPFVLIRARLQL